MISEQKQYQINSNIETAIDMLKFYMEHSQGNLNVVIDILKETKDLAK